MFFNYQLCYYLDIITTSDNSEPQSVNRNTGSSLLPNVRQYVIFRFVSLSIVEYHLDLFGWKNVIMLISMFPMSITSIDDTSVPEGHVRPLMMDS